MPPTAQPRPLGAARVRPSTLAFALSRLASERLGRSGVGRIALVGSRAVGVVFVAWIAALRAIDGATCRVGELVIESALAATWTGGFGIALAAASARSLHDRASGVDAQLLASGAPMSELGRARVLGAARRAARTMLWPVTAAGIASLAAAGSLRVLLARLVVVGLAAAYALVVGAALGATGALSDELAPRRGTLALCAVLALLAIVAGWLDDPRLTLEYVLRRPIEVALGGLGVRGVP